MTLYVLDTDLLSLLQEGNSAVLARVAACFAEDLTITVVSVEEQLSGWSWHLFFVFWACQAETTPDPFSGPKEIGRQGQLRLVPSSPVEVLLTCPLK